MPQGIAVLGFLFFTLLLWRTAAVLSPLVLTLLVWIFLYPVRRSSWAGRAMVTAAVLLVLWFLHRAWHALVPFVWGAAIAYLLDPFVDRLQRLRVPRFLGALLLVLLLLGVIVTIGLLVLPTAAGQIRDIVSQLPEAAAATERWLGKLQARVEGLGLPFQPLDVQKEILRADTVLSRLAQGALNLTKALSNALGTILNLVLVVVVSFYLLVQIDRLTAWFRTLVPPRYISSSAAVCHEVDIIVGTWFRGQLLVALLVGVFTAAGLAALSTPYASLLGLIAGVLNIIPTIGLIVTVVLAALLAPTVTHPLSYLLKVGIVFAVVQTLDSVVISAQVMRARMGLHPAVVILAVVVFATLFGAPGVILAVPVAALVRRGGQWALAHYRSSASYLSGASTPTPKEESPDAD